MRPISYIFEVIKSSEYQFVSMYLPNKQENSVGVPIDSLMPKSVPKI